MAPSSSSSSGNWVYDVFPSFSGEDIRVTFLSHFLKELDRKLIIAFKDNEIERGQSLDPKLKQAIRDSRIAVVIFSKSYASSSWCLNELLEIVKCKEEFGQLVIPVFYGLDPSHVRKQTGDFGKNFEETCKNRTEEVIIQWRGALTDAANILGYHSETWGNEATMIEAIANDVLGKLLLTSSKDFENFVGIEDHITQMSVLLHLESAEVRMVGIWGSSGIGKTTIARVLFYRLSRHFQGSIFVDRSFISKSMKIYNRANPDDYNMKLHLQGNFLSEILGKKHIKIDHLGAVGERLKQQKVLIFIDDLDDQVVLDALVGQTHWFGCGSRIVVVTKDKHFLRAHGIDHIYEVRLPSKALALEMFCRSAFKQKNPPDGFMKLAFEVAFRAGNLPLGLHVLGLCLRGRDKEDWIDMLPRLRSDLDGKIEKTLRVCYNELNNKKDEAIFRHIACLFNGEKVNVLKLLLGDSDLDINSGLKNLVDKSLLHVRCGDVEMHHWLQEMGKAIVRAQSNEPGEREFLVDSKDICDVLEDNTGTKKVLGISLDIDEIDELHIHENAFKGMRNLLFLSTYTKKWGPKKDVRWHLPEGFDYLPHKLRLLRLDGYPMRYMPSNFRPENLVKLQMPGSKLEKLWEGVHSLSGLKNMHMSGSEHLKEIPDLSMAVNLETLFLNNCSSLVELPSSIQHLEKLTTLDMSSCTNLETLPTGINLQSLDYLNLSGCSRLKSFPSISTNISILNLCQTSVEEIPSNLHLEKLDIISMCEMKSNKLWERVKPLTSLMTMLPHSLKRLFLSDIPSLVELPSSIQNFTALEYLRIEDCINLETLPTGINFQHLYDLNLKGCSRLRKFPDISTNISWLHLDKTGIEEVPWWIENFSKLRYLYMEHCNKLQRVSLNLFKLKHLETVTFSHCGALVGASSNDCPSAMAMSTDNYLPDFELDFIKCFNLDQNAFLQQLPEIKQMRLSGEEVPSYFTHRTNGSSCSLTIPLLHNPLSPPFFRLRACVVVVFDYGPRFRDIVYVKVNCQFKGRFENSFDFFGKQHIFGADKKDSHLFIFDCHIPLNKDNAQLNYDHVDVQLHVSNRMDSTFRSKSCDIQIRRYLSNITESKFKLKGWGIRLADDCSSPENQLCNPNTLPHVCEVDEENKVNEIDRGEEHGSNKRLRIT